MAKQKENGMAFEWAVGKAIAALTQFPVVDDNFSRIPRICYEEKISDKKRRVFDRAAVIAVEHILTKEEVFGWEISTAVIQFNSDAAGQMGDVRDLIIRNESKQLGISCKANHEALKHPRLSGSLDFIKKWGLSESGCSDSYWAAIKPIFKELYTLAAATMFSTDVKVGQVVLCSYDYFHLYFNCLWYFFLKKDTKLESLTSYQVMMARLRK
jgi:hypothetical protein